MLSKKVMKSIKGKIVMNKKEEYSFETRLQTMVTKKSRKYSPFVSIRTPAKVMVGLGGSIEIKFKKAINVDLTLSGLTRAPMKYLSKFIYFIIVLLLFLYIPICLYSLMYLHVNQECSCSLCNLIVTLSL